MGTISRVTTWSTGDTLSASDLNGEFDNILSTANGSLNADNLGVTAGQASASKAIVLDSNKDFANATGSNQIRNLTLSGSLKIGTTFLPDASGGADLGSTTLEWGDVYVADDKYLYMGSDQNIKIGYDETTTDSLAISAIEGAGLAITLRADEGDDAGDEWKLNVADGGTITLGNDIASAGTFVTHLTLTPHATVSSSTLALAGALTVAGTAGVTGVATVGGLTIGSAVINEADLEQIDDLTAGTVTASKAVVVDSNKDIGTFRNITIDGTFSDGNYTFDTSGNVSGLGTIGSGAITATDTTAPLILKYDAGEYVTHAVSSAGVYSIATTDASSDSGAITLDTVDSITLDSDTASEGIVYADGGTNLLRVSNSSSDVIFKPLVDAKDIVFQQYDGNEVCRIADNRRLYFYDEGGEYISSSGSALTLASGSAAWELPAADGSDGQVLETDGSGNLDWVSQTSGATLSGSTDNTVVTVTGSNAMQGEANLTFDGSTLVVTGSIDLSADIDVDGTLEADAITLGGTALGSLYSPIAGSSSIVTVGTIGTGTWQGIAVASAYLDADTAHLSTTQTFTGDKTFTGTVTVGVDDTGKDVKFFGASAGAFMLYDESADTLEVRGPSADATTSTGKLKLTTALTDINDNDVLGRIDFAAPLEAGGTDAILAGGAIWAEAEATFTSSVNSTALVFGTNTSAAASERMRISSAGVVLIPTVNGTPSLDLGGAGTSNAMIATPESMYFSIDSNNDQTDRAYIFGHNANTTGATELMKIQEDGAVLLNTPQIDMPSQAGKTTNMEIRQNLDRGIKFTHANVAHGITSYTDTDTFGELSIADGNAGGMHLYGLTEGDRAFQITTVATSSDDTKSASADGSVYFDLAEKNGTDAHAYDANDNLVVITNRTSCKWICDADGDIHYDGTTNASAWDDHDDVGLLNTFRNLTTGNKAQDVFGQFVDENAKVLHDSGVITMNNDGHHFVSTKGLNALIIDTIRQEGQKWRKVVGDYQDKLAALEARLLRLEV